MKQTIQQQRADYALKRVKALAQQLDADAQKEFTSYASSLPAMIHMNGLGQAMAFCKVKGKDRPSYAQLYRLVSDWLCQPGQPFAGQSDVLDGITQTDMADYQLAQAEALVLMSWVKKIAKAFLAEDAT
jgi:CRISPR-associated protein Cmr5